MPFLYLLIALFIFIISKGMYLESSPVAILIIICLIIETDLNKARKLLEQYF